MRMSVQIILIESALSGKIHTPDCSSYRNSRFETSEKQIPLYCGAPKDCSPCLRADGDQKYEHES